MANTLDYFIQKNELPIGTPISTSAPLSGVVGESLKLPDQITSGRRAMAMPKIQGKVLF